MLKSWSFLYALLFLIFSCVSENPRDGQNNSNHEFGKESAILARGYPVPPFKLRIAGKEEFVSNETLLGKFYLMDFWAVWCGPCIVEMPMLHKVFERFHGDNFTILSLSMDLSWDYVAKFREQWEMPWLHTFLEGGFENPLAKRFGVMGIPRPILVGPDGKVLAMEIELRGPMLERTLTTYLKSQKLPETF